MSSGASCTRTPARSASMPSRRRSSLKSPSAGDSGMPRSLRRSPFRSACPARRCLPDRCRGRCKAAAEPVGSVMPRPPRCVSTTVPARVEKIHGPTRVALQRIALGKQTQSGRLGARSSRSACGMRSWSSALQKAREPRASVRLWALLRTGRSFGHTVPRMRSRRSSSESRPAASAPSSRASARSRLCRCRATIPSSTLSLTISR